MYCAAGLPVWLSSAIPIPVWSGGPTNQVRRCSWWSDPTYLWCWIDAPERFAQHVATRHESGSAFQPRGRKRCQGRVIDHVGDALDATSRTVKVARPGCATPSRHLKGEMFVTAELTGKATRCAGCAGEGGVS